jgi:hypothetical protein
MFLVLIRSSKYEKCYYGGTHITILLTTVQYRTNLLQVQLLYSLTTVLSKRRTHTVACGTADTVHSVTLRPWSERSGHGLKTYCKPDSTTVLCMALNQNMLTTYTNYFASHRSQAEALPCPSQNANGRVSAQPSGADTAEQLSMSRTWWLEGT